jgi:hypothetical protein
MKNGRGANGRVPARVGCEGWRRRREQASRRRMRPRGVPATIRDYQATDQHGLCLSIGHDPRSEVCQEHLPARHCPPDERGLD